MLMKERGYAVPQNPTPNDLNLLLDASLKSGLVDNPIQIDEEELPSTSEDGTFPPDKTAPFYHSHSSTKLIFSRP
jgi:hypothetical protein